MLRIPNKARGLQVQSHSGKVKRDIVSDIKGKGKHWGWILVVANSSNVCGPWILSPVACTQSKSKIHIQSEQLGDNYVDRVGRII